MEVHKRHKIAAEIWISSSTHTSKMIMSAFEDSGFGFGLNGFVFLCNIGIIYIGLLKSDLMIRLKQRSVSELFVGLGSVFMFNATLRFFCLSMRYHTCVIELG